MEKEEQSSGGNGSSSTPTEVFEDTDFEKEFADVLSELSAATDSFNTVSDTIENEWVDIPPPTP